MTSLLCFLRSETVLIAFGVVDFPLPSSRGCPNTTGRDTHTQTHRRTQPRPLLLLYLHFSSRVLFVLIVEFERDDPKVEETF